MWRCNEDVFSQLLFLEEPCAQALSGKMLILVWELLSGLAKVLDILLYWVILSLYWLQGSCFCHVSTLFIPLSPCGCLVVVSIRVSAAKSAKCPSDELIVGTTEQGILCGKSISNRCRKTLSCSG
jgi:hypothetical protein